MSSFNLKHSKGPKLKIDFHGFGYPWPTVQWHNLLFLTDFISFFLEINFEAVYGFISQLCHVFYGRYHWGREGETIQGGGEGYDQILSDKKVCLNKVFERGGGQIKRFWV